MLALFIFAPLQLRALDPSLLISQYHKQYWQVEQGLPHSYVTAIRQAPEGHLLVGTDEGLARFDGLTFRPVSAEPSLNLTRRWISALLVGKDQSIWIGAFDGQILRLRDGKVIAQFQTGGSVFDLLESGGEIWASCRNGVYKVRQNGLVKVPELDPPLDTSWNVLAGAQDGKTWVATARGLFALHAGVVTPAISNGGPAGDVLSVIATRGGDVWLGTTAGLFRLPRGIPNRPVRVPDVAGPVVALLADRNETLWAGTWGQGLYRVAGGRADRWSTRDGLSDDFIRTLAEDDEGDLWIGTRSGGLGRWRQTRVVPFGVVEGLAGNYATTVATTPTGDLWLGTWRGGLYRLDSGSLTAQPLPLPTLYFTVRALAFDRAGHPWIGNWEGLFESDGRAYRRYGTEADSPFHRVSSILFSRDGSLWVGTADQGLFRFASGRPVEPPPARLFPGTEITSLLEDDAGTIWVGTSNGIARVNGGPVKDGPNERIESIMQDSARRIWLSTANGRLAIVRDSRTVVLDRRNGLPEHPLYKALEDASGSFFISSPRGILELSRESIERVFSGTATMLDITRYGQEDGMRTIECHGLSQPSGGRDRDGSLWFPTAKGFVQVRSAPTMAELPAPRVHIEEVASDAGPLRGEAEFTIPSGARNVQINFAAIRLSAPRKLQFRYRMTGFDPTWVSAGTERAARYNQLPPGPHRFEVQARDPFRGWSKTATILLRQEPHFYQTWWFLCLLALSAVAVAGALYRWRLHSVRTRYAAVLEERNRIGREWHDTLVAGFSAISLQLEAAITRLSEQPARSEEILEMTRKMVHHYRAEARRVIWDLRDNRPEGETLPMALQDVLRNVTETRGIDAEVLVEGAERELPIDIQHNVLRICQEAVSNAARHGSPARIRITLAYDADRLTATVWDNGRGFPVEESRNAAAGHYGMTVMNERARRYGGSVTVESHPGRGTTVQASIPLAGANRS